MWQFSVEGGCYVATYLKHSVSSQSLFLLKWTCLPGTSLYAVFIFSFFTITLLYKTIVSRAGHGDFLFFQHLSLARFFSYVCSVMIFLPLYSLFFFSFTPYSFSGRCEGRIVVIRLAKIKEIGFLVFHSLHCAS